MTGAHREGMNNQDLDGAGMAGMMLSSALGKLTLVQRRASPGQGALWRSGWFVGNSSITRRRPPTDSNRKTTDKVRFARHPPEPRNLEIFVSALFSK